MTLIEKAKARKKPTRAARLPSNEEVELALAWARGNISYLQVSAALGTSGSGAYPFLAITLRYYLRTDQNGSRLR